MSQNLEVWREGLKDVWLDPTRPGRYDNPELYDRPMEHGGIIHVMRGEYAITSLRDKFYQFGVTLFGPLHFPLMIFEPETGVGALGLPDNYTDHLEMTSIISEEIGEVATGKSSVICVDQKLPLLFENQVAEIAQSLQESARSQVKDVPLEEIEEKLGQIGPLYFFNNAFRSPPRLVTCDFDRLSPFKIDLRKIIPYLGFINSGRNLVSCLEKPPDSFIKGLLLEENVKQRMNLRREMRDTRQRLPICVYKSGCLLKD